MAAALAGCRQNPHQADGVELVLGSESPTPGMTFELRFDCPMVKGNQVGLEETNSPLVIRPLVSGIFTWLSARSGVFTPSEPLKLDTRYLVSLSPDLKRADGQPATARLHWTIATPPFDLLGSSPHELNADLNSEPEIKLAFNADIKASEAERHIFFRNQAGQIIPADVQQGTVEDSYARYEFSANGSLRTWLDEFFAARKPQLPRRNTEPEPSPTNAVPNLLVATPRRALTLGNGWTLVVETGVPSADHVLHLRHNLEVPIGDVTPFVVREVAVKHFILSGPSVRLCFSKPIPDEFTNNPSAWAMLSPPLTNLTATIYGHAARLEGDFRSGTTYTLKLGPRLRSTEPFKLSGSNTFTFTMPPVAPRLYFPAFSRDQMAGGHRSFSLLGVNVPQARVRAKLLEPQTAIHALRGYASYFAPTEQRREDWDEPYRALNYTLVPGRTVFDERVDFAWDPDAAQRIELPWDRLLAGRHAGVVFVDAERADQAPALGAQALIQLTDLGVVWKQGCESVDVFVFSHGKGQPVPQAAVRLLSSENETLSQAVTDAAGQGRLNAPTNAEWVAVQQGDDFHALELKENRVWAYRGDIEFSGEETSGELRRVLLFSDRNLYRPGEEVHLAALVRDWAPGGLQVPPDLTNSLSCRDGRGREFFRTNGVFSPLGSWATTIPLPATRGAYTARLHAGTNEYSCEFYVQDFQPSAFELTLQSKTAFSAGEQILVPLSARYLFGKPLARAQVKWSLEAEDMDFRPKGFEGFAFRATDREYRFGRGRASLTLQGEGTLTGSTNFVIAPEVSLNPTAPQPRMAALLVEVTDLNQQTVSHRAEFIRHSSEFYLGLRQGAEVLQASNALPLEAIAVRADGQPWPEPVKAQLKLQRVDWQNVRVQGAGKTVRYRNEAVLTNVFEQEVELQPLTLPLKDDAEVAGNRLAGLPPLDAGEYLLELRATDPAGHAVRSSLDFAVAAATQTSWNYRNDIQLTLKPARKVYGPGETAEILVESPFTGTALVSVEREKVLRSFVTRLEGNAPLIRVPLEPGDVPNVFVSVTLLRGADDCPRQIREPEFRMGCCGLRVADPQARLAVNVTLGATNCLPGQPVEITVQVSDAQSRPVPGAGVVLYAVDDGILGLTGYEAPNPHALFYAPRPLGVEAGISLPNLLTENEQQLRFDNKGYLGGGGGKEHLRKNFLACAFWNAGASTDASGKTTARFPAPDSLTRYRVFAVVHTADSRFGNGQSAFQVTKPLVIEPALPRFANFSDRIHARGVVHNQTTNATEVEVALQLDDTAKPAEPRQALSRRVPVAALGSAVVEFPVEFVGVGEAKWIWKASFVDGKPAGFTDSVQSLLEVGHVVPLMREVLLSRGTDSQTNLLAAADPQLFTGSGTVTIRVANTRLNELRESSAQLLHYPYGCAEQTVSSLLPWLLARAAPQLRPALDLQTNDAERAIQAGINRLLSMQTQSGGLGYWPRATEPMLWASAYGGMALALAQRLGIGLPERDVTRLMAYLSQQLRAAGNDLDTVSDCCLALYTLALAERAEPAYHEKFFNLRERLKPGDKAMLALAIAEANGPPEMIRTLLRSQQTGPVRYADQFGCPAREKAIRLLAWVKHTPRDPIVERFVTDLMSDQKQAHWTTTQGNAWALLALTEYARLVQGELQPAQGTLRCNGDSSPFCLDKTTNFIAANVAFSNSAPVLALVNDSHTPLYLSVLVEARPRETSVPRQDRGFGLQRRYERLDDENRLQDLAPLRVGDRVLVSLQLTVKEGASFVAVDDALPSILEPINAQFRTQEARSAGVASNDGDGWPASFQELRKDRCLFFANEVAPGSYMFRYLARVRAAGTVTAPPAKVEEMYHPERYGISETKVITSASLENR